MGSEPVVAILMGTYNGARFLQEQLDSITVQTHKNWFLVASDDGSSDDTLAILQRFQQEWGDDRVRIRQGPGKGFCQNFLSMACDPEIRADNYAFCDQDDVWFSDKLQNAIGIIIQSTNADKPFLYGGRTIYTTDDLEPLSKSPLICKPCSFGNALVENFAGGNTMVFNHPLKLVLEKVGLVPVVAHDWWLYQLASGIGGSVYYDAAPHINYRLHSNALIGGYTGWMARWKRALRVLGAVHTSWFIKNHDALKQADAYLTDDARSLLREFKILREGKLVERVSSALRSGIHRQTRKGTLALILGALIKRI